MGIVVRINRLHVGGLAFFPFIFLRKNISSERLHVLLNHEKIHIRQQLELLVIPFYVFYLLNYLINLLRYRNHDLAYRKIIFEKEAFAEEANEGYLKKRRFWNFLKYITSKLL